MTDLVERGRMEERATSSVEGVLNVCKPVGMTSHDVVDAARRLAHTRRVGHTGTLDPGATGVLVLVFNRATRIAEFLADADKEYRVEVTFGKSTDSGDAYGRTVREAPADTLTGEQVAAALPQFVGEIAQVPPLASAVHVGGRRLYELAREGVTIEVPPRHVWIYQLTLLDFVATSPPSAVFRVARWQQLVGAPVVRLRDATGLVALARVEEGLLRPFKVLRD